MGNEEPVFVARSVRLAAPPRVMKERHVSLQFTQEPRGMQLRALGWNWAERIASMQLAEGSLLDLAYHIRENEHPEYGGIELEIAGLQPAMTEEP
jgi:single-stranded-DNA-specific exonuclease